MSRMSVYCLRLLLVALVVALGACGRETPPADAPALRSVEQVADEYLAAWLQRYPEYGTYFGIVGAPQDSLYDNSLSAIPAWRAREDAWLAELEAIGAPAEIGSRDWLTWGVLHEKLQAAVATRVCRQELWSASRTTAWYNDLPYIFQVQPLDTPELQKQALTRLARVDEYIDTEIENLSTGLELGFSAPRVTVQGVSDEVRVLLDDGNPFSGMADRVDDAEFDRQVDALFASEVAPAIERFARFVDDVYLPQAREALAVSANPDGASCYPALIREFATVSPSPEEVHRTGLAQMAAIRAEMQAIIDENYGGGDIGDFLRRMNDDPQFMFPSGEATIEAARGGLADARAAMQRAFHRLPSADVIVEPYPAHRDSAVGEYNPPAEDGSRPGIFYLPGRPRPRATLWGFMYHETYPGHHLQGAIALELGDRVHPVLRYLGNSGFSEGWGLYAERLADELGLYREPIDRLGMLSEQGARASRLVVDTGLHTMGWTRQQALDYMLDNTAWPEVELQDDIDRYISWPGQAVSYMLGMLEILRLRNLAEQTLGTGYDIRDFHAHVLENGEITLPMLDEVITNWIAEAAGDSE